MAINNITASRFRMRVVFKSPTTNTDQQGQRTISYANAFTKWAEVRPVNRFRGSVGPSSPILELTDEVNCRYDSQTVTVTKDWLISWNSKDYVIHEIENVDNRKEYITFRAKTK